MVLDQPGNAEQRRNMCVVGIRISEFVDLLLIEDMGSWGDEPWRYFCGPSYARMDTSMDPPEVHPDVIFAGDIAPVEAR